MTFKTSHEPKNFLESVNKSLMLFFKVSWDKYFKSWSSLNNTNLWKIKLKVFLSSLFIFFSNRCLWVTIYYSSIDCSNTFRIDTYQIYIILQWNQLHRKIPFRMLNESSLYHILLFFRIFGRSDQSYKNNHGLKKDFLFIQQTV